MVKTDFFKLGWFLFFTGPSVFVDGVEVVRTWGTRTIPAFAGHI
jgi:hypothetical protein